ncbi:hypothetical protein Tco_1383866 [Tanacetum coccineum]
MTGNKAYLVEYQDYNGDPVAFGGSKSQITGKDKVVVQFVAALVEERLGYCCSKVFNKLVLPGTKLVLPGKVGAARKKFVLLVTVTTV